MRRLRSSLPQLLVFGGVGAIAFVVDTGVFNLLRATVLADEVVLAKVLAATVSIAVAWIGHRRLTFRGQGRHPIGREAALFAVANLGGLLIAAGCVWLSHDVLGFRTVLADNVSGSVVGVALGTAFRFACYRLLVFGAPAESGQPKSPAASLRTNGVAGAASTSSTVPS